MTLSLLIQVKAMVLALRSSKSAVFIQRLLRCQRWSCSVRLQMARIRQIAEGLGYSPSCEELCQLKTLVFQWEAGRK
jgi:hypothetical protein